MLPYGLSILGAYVVNPATAPKAQPTTGKGASQDVHILAVVNGPEVQYAVAGQAVEPCPLVAATGDLPVPQGWVALRCAGVARQANAALHVHLHLA